MIRNIDNNFKVKFWQGPIELDLGDLGFMQAVMEVNYAEFNGQFKTGAKTITVVIPDQIGKLRHVDVTKHLSDVTFDTLFEYYVVQNN